jgi:hypothetical protein
MHRHKAAERDPANRGAPQPRSIKYIVELANVVVEPKTGIDGASRPDVSTQRI